MSFEQLISHHRAAGHKMLAVLLDPENLSDSDSVRQIGSLIGRHRPDFVFVGGSTFYSSAEPLISALRPLIGRIPVVLFPGHPSQFTPAADALLFLTLLSGRNPDTLIGQQIAAARQIHDSGIEVLPMGYILVEGGRQSTTSKVTGTDALPADALSLIADTALAGQLLGLRSIYLEAGSGASTPASEALIQAVRASITCPLIVGGGIHTPAQAQSAWSAGADIVVIGNHLEHHPSDLPLFTSARPSPPSQS